MGHPASRRPDTGAAAPRQNPAMTGLPLQHADDLAPAAAWVNQWYPVAFLRDLEYHDNRRW